MSFKSVNLSLDGKPQIWIHTLKINNLLFLLSSQIIEFDNTQKK